MALFSRHGPGFTDGQRHYVEMRAGKMYRQGTMVYPDLRKGRIYIYQSSDSMMHFCWLDRNTNVVEDDFIIFPGDCAYMRVRQCTTGRVYLLKFNNSTARNFYWLQEPGTDKDLDHCKRINYLLNHPPSQSASFPGLYLPYLLNSMSQSQLVRLFGPNMGNTLASLRETPVRSTGPTPSSSNQEDNLPSTSAESDNVDLIKVHNTTPETSPGGSNTNQTGLSFSETSSDVNIKSKPSLTSPKFVRSVDDKTKLSKRKTKKVTIQDNELYDDKQDEEEYDGDESDVSDDDEEDEVD